MPGSQSPMGIAVVGLSGRFPGANSAEEFWSHLIAGKDCVAKPPEDRRYLRGGHQAECGYLKCRLDEFDGAFFNLSPKECPFVDPQQRLFLEVGWESLEDAGIRPSTLVGSNTGVFLGINNNEYGASMGPPDETKDYIYELMGTTWSGSTGRFSHFLGLNGPSVAVESTCASAAVAIHMACQSLRNRESNLALAGGVNILLDQPQKFPPNVLSNRCKTFDEQANGFVPSEGCAVVVLKRLDDAVRDRDNIIGVIRGSAVAHDGKTRGLGTPNSVVQAKVISEAMAMAEIQPSEISYVELHGTGTRVGDVAEINSLTQAFGTAAANRDQPLILGATKTNIGHSLAASGALSLVKLLMCLKHRVVPKVIQFKTLNPRIDLQRIGAQIPLENIKLTGAHGGHILASLNTFGITGTVVHMIIEEGRPYMPTPMIKSLSAPEQPIYIFNISAKNPEALKSLCAEYSSFAANSSINFEQFAASVNLSRDHFNHRISVLAKDKDRFLEKLMEHEDSTHNYLEGVVSAQEKVAFLFTGHGSQYSGMGKVLYESCPFFQNAFDKCAKSFKEKFNISLKTYLWAEDEALEKNNRNRMNNPLLSQPAYLCLQVALFQLWSEGFGVKADAVLGHSFGEYAAAVAAGVLSFQDAMNLVCGRSKLINDELPKGSMLALSGPAVAVAEALEEFRKVIPESSLDIAAINCPGETVVSGAPEDIHGFRAFCTSQFKGTVLHSEHAFHSRALEIIMEDIEELAAQMKVSDPKCTYVSSLLGREVKTKEEFPADYWSNHLRETVKYSDAARVLLQNGYTHFIEIGAHPILSNLTLANVSDGAELVLCASLRRCDNDWNTLLGSLGKLYVSWGGHIDWSPLFYAGLQERVILPHYPFQRKCYWMKNLRTDIQNGIHPLLGKAVDLPGTVSQWYTNQLSKFSNNFLKDHAVLDEVVLPGACYLETIMGYYALGLQRPLSTLVVEQLQFQSPMCLTGEQLKYTTVVSEDQEIEIFSQKNEKWTKHCTARVLESNNTANHSAKNFPTALANPISTAAVYEAFQKCKITMGPQFQSLYDVKIISGSELKCKVRALNNEKYVIHPILLDAMIQAFWYFQVEQKSDCQSDLILPSGVDRVKFWDTEAQLNESSNLTIHLYAAGATVMLYNNGLPIVQMDGLTVTKATRNSFRNKSQAHPDIYQEKWVKVKTCMGQRADMENISALQKTSPWIWSLEQTVKISRAASLDFDARMETLSYLYILKTLYSLGWSPMPGDQVTSEYFVKKLPITDSKHFMNTFHRFLVILEEEDLVETNEHISTANALDDTFTVLCGLPSRKEVDELILALPEITDKDNIEFRFLTHCGQGLLEVFNGEMTPLQLLFSNPAVNASLLYQHGHMFTLDTETLTSIFKGVVEAVKISNGSALRILEVGAGTGATTRQILARLNDLQIPFEYTFTDIGATFLHEAQRKFASYKDSMEYRSLDIEKEPRLQGFVPASYDVVIASNVLHATQDLNNTMKNVREVLCVGGCLFVTELKRKYRLCDLSFGLLEGWWKFTDFRQRDMHPLIDFRAWEKVLTATGFVEAVNVLESGCFVARKSLTIPSAPNNGSSKIWLVYGQNSDALAAKLGQINIQSMQVMPGEEYGVTGTQITVRFSEYTDFEKMAESLKNKNLEVEGVVFLANSAAGFQIAESSTDLESKQQAFVSGFIHLLKLNVLQLPSQRVVLVTSGAKYVAGTKQHAIRPFNGTLYGIMNAFMNEHPDFQCSTVDLCPLSHSPETQALQIISQLWMTDLPRTIAFRGEDAWVSRLVPAVLPKEANGLDLPQTGDYRIVDDFSVQMLPKDRENCIQIRVEAVGLNFRDVLLANNLLPEIPRHYGFEFAGTITNSGLSRSFQVGDRVMGATNGGAMGNVVCIKDPNLLMKIPDTMSFKEAATIPIAFGTAFHALIKIADIHANDKVLIHTGSGGLGLAAIQIAQFMGCEIFATAGSERKRNFLRNSVGVVHVYDSRNQEDYLAGILNQTNGVGVDVVLNTLTGPGFIESSLKALNQVHGRFVELSKLNIWSPEEVHKLRQNAKYDTLDIAEMIKIGSLPLYESFATVGKLCEMGGFKSLPYTTYQFTQLKQALKYFQSGQHIGKIVIAVGSNTIFNPESLYMVTGGLGGLGLRVCDWILERGGQNVVLVGRNLPSKEAEAALAVLRAKGNVIVYTGDISDYQDCVNLMHEIKETGFPLRGICHSAGVLADGVVVNQCWENFQKVFRPKVIGSWNLHELTKGMDLDFFVLFSSIAAIVGTPGQSNHSAANSFMDALAHHRVEECGLKALSINWGAWGEIGAAAKLTGGLYDKVHHFTPQQGIAGLELALGLGQNQVLVADIDADIGTTILPKLRDYMSVLKKPNARGQTTEIATKKVSKASVATFDTLAKEIAEDQKKGEANPVKIEALVEFTLRFYSGQTGETGVMDKSCSLNVLGMDSLMGMEVRSKLCKVLGLNITMSAFQANNSIRALATHIRELILQK